MFFRIVFGIGYGGLFVAIPLFAQYSYEWQIGLEYLGIPTCYNPSDAVVDKNGNIYVIEYDRIQKFAPDGTFLSKFGSRGSDDGEFKRPSGIAVDSVGNVYVVDRSNHRIQKFSLIVCQFLGRLSSKSFRTGNSTLIHQQPNPTRDSRQRSIC